MKVGSSAGWNIPYLDFSSNTPTLGSVTLPSNYVGFRGGTYCHTNGCVYIPMGTVDNGSNAYVLKITSANTASALTFSGAVNGKQFNSSMYTPDDRVCLYLTDGTLMRIKPDDSLDTNLTVVSSRFLQFVDKRGNLFLFPNSAGISYATYKFPILVKNNEILNPVFNCMK